MERLIGVLGAQGWVDKKRVTETSVIVQIATVEGGDGSGQDNLDFLETDHIWMVLLLHRFHSEVTLFDSLCVGDLSPSNTTYCVYIVL